MSSSSCEPFVLPSDLKKFIGSEHSRSVLCIHVNCQSARNKMAEFDMMFSSLNLEFHFIMLSETWYHKSTPAWCPLNYDCFSRSRSVSRGGGVSMLV